MKSKYVSRVQKIQNDIPKVTSHTPQRLMELIRNLYWQLNGLIQEMESEVLLFPDMSKEQHYADHFVYAAACTPEEYYMLRDRCKTKEPEAAGFLPYTFIEEDEETICIIPRPRGVSDDDCLGTAAYVRMVEEFTGFIYAVPFTEKTALGSLSLAQVIAKTAGVDPAKVRHITL